MALSLQADLQRFLQIVFTNQPEPVVDYLIEGADGLIIDYLGFDPQEDAALAEIHDPTGTFDLWVRRPPIASVATITIDGTALAATAFEVYLEDEDKSGLIHRIDGQRWASKRRGIIVTYAAGYATIPFPLRDASIRIVARAFQKGAEFAAEGRTPGVTQIALAGSDSITWSESANDVSTGALQLTAMERQMVSRYKRAWIA